MHWIDELVQKIYGFSDYDILREFEAAEAEVKAEGGEMDCKEGFERLWRRLVWEQERERRS